MDGVGLLDGETVIEDRRREPSLDGDRHVLVVLVAHRVGLVGRLVDVNCIAPELERIEAVLAPQLCEPDRPELPGFQRRALLGEFGQPREQRAVQGQPAVVVCRRPPEADPWPLGE